MSTEMADILTGDALEEAAGTEFSFSLSKDQITQVNSTFKAAQHEDFIRVSVFKENYIEFALDDMGVQIWTNIQVSDINLNGLDTGLFFINKKMVSKIADATKDIVKFKVNAGQMLVDISGSDLHISLPMFSQTVDTRFSEVSKETKSNDFVTTLVKRLSASKGVAGFKLNCMHLGKEALYGTTQSISILGNKDSENAEDYIFETVEANIEPRCLDYISSITFTGGNIDFILTEADEVGYNSLVIHSENVFIKVRNLKTQFDDLTDVLAEEKEGSLLLNTLSPVDSLKVLSIPLVGSANPLFTVQVPEGGDHINISVKDEGNRVSTDKWNVTGLTGCFNANLAINDFLSVVAALDPEVTVESTDSMLLIKDSKQTVILIKHL